MFLLISTLFLPITNILYASSNNKEVNTNEENYTVTITLKNGTDLIDEKKDTLHKNSKSQQPDTHTYTFNNGYRVEVTRCQDDIFFRVYAYKKDDDSRNQSANDKLLGFTVLSLKEIEEKEKTTTLTINNDGEQLSLHITITDHQ